MKYYDYNFDLGDKLKELRKRSGKTIEQISEEVDCSPRTVHNYENGSRPSISIYHRYLDVLDVSPEERIELIQLAYGKR